MKGVYQTMKKDEIINAIGPCSLLCYTCFGYMDGGIQYHASKLFELYKGWYSGHVHAYGANPTEQQIEKLKRIKIFNEMLKEMITHPKCTGCHSCIGKCDSCIKGCIIPECSKNHGVDFCAQCDEFPCEKDIPHHIKTAWLNGNNYIKIHGFEKYFEEHKHIAHYIGCYNSDIE